MYGVGTRPCRSPPRCTPRRRTFAALRARLRARRTAHSPRSAVPSAQVAGFDVTPALRVRGVARCPRQLLHERGSGPGSELPSAAAVRDTVCDALAGCARGPRRRADEPRVQHFDPDNVRPTLDLSANEPEPQFADEAWPEKVPTLVSLKDSSGLRQSLNLTTGQFFTGCGQHMTAPSVSGRTSPAASRTRRATTSFNRRSIRSTRSSSNGVVTFTGHFSDLTETESTGQRQARAGRLRRRQPRPLAVAAAAVRLVDRHLWTGGAAFTGTNVQFFVEACDDAGNCGFSSNKGRYYDAQPVPAATGTLTLAPRTSPNAAGFYTGTVDVDAADPAAGRLSSALTAVPMSARPRRKSPETVPTPSTRVRPTAPSRTLLS